MKVGVKRRLRRGYGVGKEFNFCFVVEFFRFILRIFGIRLFFC